MCEVILNWGRNLHLSIFQAVQPTHGGMVQVSWLFSCRIFPATVQCLSCSSYPSLVHREEFSDVLLQKFGHPDRETRLINMKHKAKVMDFRK